MQPKPRGARPVRDRDRPGTAADALKDPPRPAASRAPAQGTGRSRCVPAHAASERRDAGGDPPERPGNSAEMAVAPAPGRRRGRSRRSFDSSSHREGRRGSKPASPRNRQLSLPGHAGHTRAGAKSQVFQRLGFPVRGGPELAPSLRKRPRSRLRTSSPNAFTSEVRERDSRGFHHRLNQDTGRPALQRSGEVIDDGGPKPCSGDPTALPRRRSR